MGGKAPSGGNVFKAVSRDILRGGKGLMDYQKNLTTGNLGGAAQGANDAVTAAGQATGLVERPEDKPEAPTFDDTTPGIETPDEGKVTQDQNDAIRKRIGSGGRRASGLLFGGGGVSSTSLLGF